jgi:putative transcriptional regulator
MKKKAKNEVFENMMQGAMEALAFAKGEADLSKYRVHIPPELDVRAIRKRLRLTQQEFADRYGFNIARIRDWEQGRSCPDGALRAYLIVIARKHEAVDEALRVA